MLGFHHEAHIDAIVCHLLEMDLSVIGCLDLQVRLFEEMHDVDVEVQRYCNFDIVCLVAQVFILVRRSHRLSSISC